MAEFLYKSTLFWSTKFYLIVYLYVLVAKNRFVVFLCKNGKKSRKSAFLCCFFALILCKNCLKTAEICGFFLMGIRERCCIIIGLVKKYKLYIISNVVIVLLFQQQKSRCHTRNAKEQHLLTPSP